jgi:DUF1009 family protein
MEPRLGVIAGSGEFPIYVCQEAQGKGYLCVVAGIKGEAENILERYGENFAWFDIHEIGNLIDFFKKNQVSEAVFAGKIDHRKIYKSEKLREILPLLLGTEKDWAPTSLIQTAIQIFSTQGIAIQDPTPYIASALCEEGILTEAKPSPQMEEEILFGWDIAKKLADLDIGQTVIVKGKAVVAVEGIEGTDRVGRTGDRCRESQPVLSRPAHRSASSRTRDRKKPYPSRRNRIGFRGSKNPFFPERGSNFSGR